MHRLKDRYDRAEIARIVDRASPPTDDDVPIAADGRRLDSPEAVITFFEELRGRSSAGSDA